MKIREFTAILVCKIVRCLAKLFGRGSSLPGKFALKICPDILSHLELPELSIAVTGSNGKTSTVEMIAHVLTSNGLKVAYNKEGSNQIEGVTTFLIGDSTMKGKVKSDVVLLEADERYARHTFKYFHPKFFVINNLYRDQMTRNGHPEWIKNIIGQAIYDDMTLILNSDDPLVASFGKDREGTIYFGAGILPGDTLIHEGIYDDGKYCPICKKPVDVDLEMLEINKVDPKPFEGVQVYGPVGCPQCHNSGYKGRGAMMEVLPISPKIRALIEKGGDAELLKTLALEEGMVTLKEAGMLKVRAGITSLEAAFEVTGGD